MERYCSMKDIACDIEEIAEDSGLSYDVLARMVETQVKRFGHSYEEAVSIVRKFYTFDKEDTYGCKENQRDVRSLSRKVL